MRGGLTNLQNLEWRDVLAKTKEPTQVIINPMMDGWMDMVRRRPADGDGNDNY